MEYESRRGSPRKNNKCRARGTIITSGFKNENYQLQTSMRIFKEHFDK